MSTHIVLTNMIYKVVISALIYKLDFPKEKGKLECLIEKNLNLF